MLSRILLFSLSMIIFSEANGQWDGGNTNAPYIRLSPGHDEYGISIRDVPVGFGQTPAKLQVYAQPNFHEDVLVDFQGFAMNQNDRLLQLGMELQSSSITFNPLFIDAQLGDGTSGARFQVDSRGVGSFNSAINLVHFSPSYQDYVAIRVRGDEALWYDGTYYSWGHGGSWNRFTQPITIGSATMPSPTMGLRVDDYKGIEIVGGGSLNVGGGILEMDGGDIEVIGGSLTFKKDTGKNIFFQNNSGTITSSSILAESNFLKLDNDFQVVIAANDENQLTISRDFGAYFDTNITLKEDRKISFGNNVALPEALIYHEEILGKPYGRLQIENKIENGEIVLSTDAGQIQISNGIGAGVFLKDGNVGISEKEPLHTLHVAGNVGITGEFFALSDRRIKEDIDPIAEADSILGALNPVTYNYKNETYTTLTLSDDLQYGLIAQEVEEVLPTLITIHSIIEDVNGKEVKLKGVNYTSIIPILIKGYQEQQSTLEKVMKRLEFLEQALAEK